MKAFSKLLNLIATLFTLAVIVLACILYVPRLFGTTPYIVLSGSMEPTIETGSVVYIDTKDTDVEPNDIIAFKETDGTMVTHRAIRYDEAAGAFVTKGDNNDIEDFNPVPPERVVGTYKTHIPKMGYALAKFSERQLKIGDFEVPFGPVLLIGALIFLNGFAMMVGNLAADDEDEDDEDEDDDEYDEYDEDEDDDEEEWDEDDDNEFDED